MCSSDKQNMDTEIENSVLEFFSGVLHKTITGLKKKGTESKRKGTELEKKGTEIKKKRMEIEKKGMELKKLVENLRGSIVNGECGDPTLAGKLNEAEICGNAIHYLFQDISQVRNVVDLSVTGLTKDSLKTFWDTLEKFQNLTSLGVAVTDKSDITLPDCKDKLKKLKENLKRLRMEGSHSGLKKLGEFGKLNDLTLASHKNMDIGEIPDLPELLCLRLYGVCQIETCKIELKGCPNLKKLVIGDMETVKRVEIGDSVLTTVVTLKFSNLPLLKEVAYTNNQYALLTWETSEMKVHSKEFKPSKTIFLKDFKDFPVNNSPGLEIYKYDGNAMLQVKCNPKQ